MGHLLRRNRVIVANGGKCPSLERLSNGDLLVAYCDITQPGVCISLTRSKDGGNTWCKEHTFAEGAGPGDESMFYGHHGMAQLADGTILLPYMSFASNPDPMIILRKSTDQGHTWSDPIQVLPGPGGAEGWAAAPSYGKIKTLRDGSVIMPVCARKRGERFGRNGYLRSTDNGETWPEYVTASHDRHAGDENDFIQLPTGRILCVARDPTSVQGHGVGPFYCCWSDDDGKTWSDLEMVSWSDPRHGHSPSFFLTKKNTLICTYRYVAEMDHLNIGGVAFCYVTEDGMSWGQETYVWGGIMLMSLMLGVDCMGAGYGSMAYADDERILLVHHNEQPANVCPRDLEGIFFVEGDDDVPVSVGATHVM